MFNVLNSSCLAHLSTKLMFFFEEGRKQRAKHAIFRGSKCTACRMTNTALKAGAIKTAGLIRYESKHGVISIPANATLISDLCKLRLSSSAYNSATPKVTNRWRNGAALTWVAAAVSHSLTLAQCALCSLRAHRPPVYYGNAGRSPLQDRRTENKAPGRG